MSSSGDYAVNWGADRHKQGSLGIPLGDVRHALTTGDYRLPQPVLIEVPQGIVPDDLGVLSPETPKELAAAIVKGRLKLLIQRADMSTIRLHFMNPTRTLIGRSPNECDVILRRESISRKHSSVSRLESGWHVTDEGSAYGSALEGKALEPKTPAPLVGGQLLHFASYGAMFLFPDQLHQLAASVRAATAPRVIQLPHEQGSLAPGFAPTPAGVPFWEVLNAASQPGFIEQWNTPCMLQIPVERYEREQKPDPLSETMDDSTLLDPADETAALTLRISPDELQGLKQLKKVGEARLHPLTFAGGQTELVIGRSSKSDLILDEETVSKAHALLRLGLGGEWFLEDSTSHNGTFVGGSRLPPGLPILLKGGEKLWFAAYRALFLLPPQFQRLVANNLR